MFKSDGEIVIEKLSACNLTDACDIMQAFLEDVAEHHPDIILAQRAAIAAGWVRDMGSRLNTLEPQYTTTKDEA